MNQVTELVHLPDPVAQPLVHPLDLAEARRQFRYSWIIETLTSPAVGLCVAAIVWYGTRSYVVPLIAGAALVGFGAMASRVLRDEAWAFVPRKRQDRQRSLPPNWQLISGLVFAAVLAAALLLVILRIKQSDIGQGVREFSFGSGVGVGLLVLVDLARKLLSRDRDRRSRALHMLPAIVAIFGCIALAYSVLLGSSGPAPSATLIWGLLTMLAVGAGVGVWEYVEGKRGIQLGGGPE